MQFYKGDDGGYTVVYEDGDVVVMNGRPKHPQHGVSQFIGNIDQEVGRPPDPEAFGEEVDGSQVPTEVVEAAEDRLG